MTAKECYAIIYVSHFRHYIQYWNLQIHTIFNYNMLVFFPKVDTAPLAWMGF